MYIAYLRTKNDHVAIEKECFGEALNTLHRLMEEVTSEIEEAVVAEQNDLDYSIDDLTTCDVVAVLSTIK